MLEKDKYKFFDTKSLNPTPGIAKRANEAYIRGALESLFPKEKFVEIKVVCNMTGVYQGKASIFDRLWGSGKKITGLPPYYEVEIRP